MKVLSNTLVRQARKMSSNTFVHEIAVKGFTAKEASMYNQGRPSYNDTSLDKINQILLPHTGISKRLMLIELGAGTGKFTNAYANHTSLSLQTEKYIAVEPSDGFRASLSQSAPQNVEVVNGTGSSIPVSDHSADAVVAAQAFHWMATESTLQEIHRVLQPNRPLILIWNTYDYSKSWLKQIDEEILSPAYVEGVPRQQNGKWRECFDTTTGRNLFTDIQFWHDSTEHVGTEQLVYDRILSTSVIAEKNEADRAVVRAQIKNILATHPELEEARRTNKYSIPYITEIAWCNSK